LRQLQLQLQFQLQFQPFRERLAAASVFQRARCSSFSFGFSTQRDHCSSNSISFQLQQLSDVRFGSNLATCASAAKCASAATQRRALRQQLNDVRFGSNSAACTSTATWRHAISATATAQFFSSMHLGSSLATCNQSPEVRAVSLLYFLFFVIE
jgi:hypothetical protein